MQETNANIWLHLVMGKSIAGYESGLLQQFYKYLLSIKYKDDYLIDTVNGSDDHIHILLSVSPNISVDVVAAELKKMSVEWVRNNSKFGGTFKWDEGYSVFSVSPSQLQKMRIFIKNQETHHESVSYLQEINSFLEMIQKKD